MLVFNKLRCMFTPVCKVGTNSFFNYWGGIMYGEEDSMIRELKDGEAMGINTKIVRHHLRKRIRRDFDVKWNPLFRESVAGYYKFAFVRNPWVRAVSAFRELIRRYPFGQAKANEEAGLTYHKIYDLMGGYVDFENFIDFIVNIEGNHAEVINGHWRTQIISLNMHHKEGAIEYDFLGRLENADKDMIRAQKRLGLEFSNPLNGHPLCPDENKLSKEHETAAYDYKTYYKNKKLIDMVGEYYKADIETFGYEFK